MSEEIYRKCKVALWAATLILCAILGFKYAPSDNQQRASEIHGLYKQSIENTTVYICTDDSHYYHTKVSCPIIKQCQGNVISVDKSEVEHSRMPHVCGGI